MKAVQVKVSNCGGEKHNLVYLIAIFFTGDNILGSLLNIFKKKEVTWNDTHS